MLNEASPGLLMEFINGQIIHKYSLDFAPDYSGIFYNAALDCLWIASDESQCIYQCTLEGKLLITYQHNIDKVEGIVFDNESSSFWVCSDSQNKLYKLELK